MNKEELIEQAKKIQDIQTDILLNVNNKESAQLSADEVAEQTMVQIFADADERVDKAFSNEAKRKVEQKKRLADDEQHKSSMGIVKICEDHIKRYNIDLSFEKRIFSINLAFVGVEK